MNPDHDRAADLRLLTVLDVLLDERHVTRTAARLGVTQSSVSHSLRRLRERFDDALLVRAGSSFVLTPRAEALRSSLSPLMEQLDTLRRGTHRFDPQGSSRHLRVIASDLFTGSVLPGVMKRLGRAAPNIRVSVRPVSASPMADLEHGVADLLIAGPVDAPPGIHARELFRDDFACLVRKDHPRIRRAPSLPAYLAETHVLVAPRGRPGSRLDDALAAEGHRRRIALMLPHFMAAAMVVATSDLVVTLPSRVARLLARRTDLRRVAVPVASLDYSMSAYWHSRVASDEATTWFLEQIVQETKAASR